MPKEPEEPKKPDFPVNADDLDEPFIPVVRDTADEPSVSAEPDVPAKPDTPEETNAADKPDMPTDEVPVTQGADSRVPAEARRMAAAPYGDGSSAMKKTGSQKRVPVPGTRPPRTGESRTPDRPGPGSSARVPADGTVKQPVQPPKVRVHIGYAPGRMSDGETQQIPSEKAVRESLYSRDAKAYLEKRQHPFRNEDSGKSTLPPTAHKGLKAVVAVLIVIGLLITGWLIKKSMENADGQIIREAPQVISFGPPENTTGLIAPVDLAFSVVTAKDTEGIQLSADGDRGLDTEVYLGDNAETKNWMIKMHVETGFEGTVTLQVRRSEEEGWYDTDYSAEIEVSSTPATEKTAKGDQENGEKEAGQTGEEGEAPADNGAEGEPEDEPVTSEKTEDKTGEGIGEESGDKPGEEPGDEEGTDAELPMGELRTQEPTATPAPATPEPTETPALEAEADPNADPGLITNVTVWTSNTKKEKNYSRPAKQLIHMPEADEYTPRKFGVMTFRGDNFRRNAAAGTMSAAPLKLSVMWKTEAGSARGTNTTYYGYEWTGQPAIVLWSTEIKEHSNITDEKKQVRSLKEVIIAGVDGSIRFLDLKDGKSTRDSIKLGYAMKGTPSVHSLGYPFMAVGQYARKMRNKTGMIGLRQYTLFNQEPTKVIDGLDGKYHRPENDIGSFETSALIDRTSDTLIAVGTNGALYLEALNSSFDYNLGIMKIAPEYTVMTSRVKGVKKNALLAVESSPAAYDRYVYYADMGGVLRCVDTNTLKPVWAVNTGDSVMAAIAMDMTENRELNLYTANMLNNRKKGDSDIQIRRYDAMSGKEAWCTDIGVTKGKKDKDDVGAKASPVIGQHRLNDLVYFTVTGLSDEGRSRLGVGGAAKSALIALDKETGSVAWAFGMDSRTESSPVAVYDKEGNGWIVQCEQAGLMHLLDGRTGAKVDTLDLEAEIEASPAAYNNVVVIGTTGKGTSNVFAVEIKLDKAEETPVPEENAEEDGNTEGSEGAGNADADGEMPEDDGDAVEEMPEDDGDVEWDTEEREMDDDEDSGGA